MGYFLNVLIKKKMYTYNFNYMGILCIFLNNPKIIAIGEKITMKQVIMFLVWL